MSQNSSNQKWKISTIAFAIGFIIMLGLSTYTLVQNNNLNNDKTNLQNNYNTLKTTNDANVQKIDGLEAQVDSLNAQISTLQAQATANAIEITHLQTELAANYTLLQSLEASNIIVLYHYTYSNPSLLGCFLSCSATLQDFAYANTGTETATNVILTITFYDFSNTVLCSITQTLVVSAKGDSINGQTNVDTTCNWSIDQSLDTALTTAKVSWS